MEWPSALIAMQIETLLLMVKRLKPTMDIQLQLVQMQLLTGLEVAKLEFLPIEE